ncbi:hypothetical protein CMI37_23495 [Candidatus Pacearchaeota archaeon]|nr:hypothetical protein [Candidatus Pacearchaeota archaeon]
MEKIVKKLVGDRWRDAHVRKCLWEGCGKEFKATVTEINKGDGRFCTQSCGAYHSNAQRKPHKLKCEICGDTFYNVMPQAKYCSTNCRRHQKRKKSKEYNSKPENHVYHIAGKIKKKYGRIPCLVIDCGCGWTTAFLEANDMVCEMHHIKPRREGRDDSISNLAPMCPNSHKLADKGKLSRDKMVSIEEYIKYKEIIERAQKQRSG